MIEDESSREICENCPAILVDREKKIALWIESYSMYISPVRERKGMRLVADHISFVAMERKPRRLVATYLIRSKTVTRLPTGESRLVPGGSKMMLPLQ